jgi:hypothetical protein
LIHSTVTSVTHLETNMIFVAKLSHKFVELFSGLKNILDILPS